MSDTTLKQRLPPLAVSLGGVPFNKPHLDAKDATIASLRDANKALTAEVADITGTLKYCEGCWADERGTMIDKIQFERARADRLSAELAEARKALEFYADPLDFVTRNNLDEATPDFYDELDTGWRARSFLASKEASQ